MMESSCADEYIFVGYLNLITDIEYTCAEEINFWKVSNKSSMPQNQVCHTHSSTKKWNMYFYYLFLYYNNISLGFLAW
jgi:hypothetical protein